MQARALAVFVASALAACSPSGEAGPPQARSAPLAPPPPEAVADPGPTPLSADANLGEERTLAASPKPARSPYAFANDDPSDDLIVAPPEPREDCHDALAAAGVKYADAKIPVHHEGKGRSPLTCGADQAVLFRGSPARIAVAPPPIVTCTMALALARFETVVQEEATRTLGERVVKITQLGTYACREMAAYRGWVSEHAYANAIDVESFVLASGKRIFVLHDFERGEETRTPAGTFLRAVSHRAYDEGLFSNVLTPFFDELHRNHFHLDLARYRNDGSRPSEDDR